MAVVVAIHKKKVSATMRWMWNTKTSGWRMRGKKDEGMVCDLSEEAQTVAVEWMMSGFRVVGRGHKPVAER